MATAATVSSIGTSQVVPWFASAYNVDAWRPSSLSPCTPLPLIPLAHYDYVPCQRLVLADPFGQLHAVTTLQSSSSCMSVVKNEVPLSPLLTSLVSYDNVAQPKVEDLIVMASSHSDHTCIIRVMHQYSHDDDDDVADTSMDSQPDWLEVWPMIPKKEPTNDTSDDDGGMMMMEPVSSPARVVHLPGRLIWLPPSSRDADDDSASDNDDPTTAAAEDGAAMTYTSIELGYFAAHTRITGRSRLPIASGRDVVWSIRTLADGSDAILILTGTTLTKPRSLWLCHVAADGQISNEPYRVCRGMIQHVLPLRSGQCVIHMDGTLQLWSLTNHGRLFSSAARDIRIIHSCPTPLSIRVQWFELTTPGRIVAITSERVIIYNSVTNSITYSQPLTGVRTICVCNSIRHIDCVIVEMELNGSAVVELWQLSTDGTDGAIASPSSAAAAASGTCMYNGIMRQLLWYSDDQMMGNIDQIVSLQNGLVCMIRVSYDNDHRTRSNLCIINLLHQSPLLADATTNSGAAEATNPMTYSRCAAYVGRLIGGDTGPMMLLSLPSLRSAVHHFGRALYDEYDCRLPSPLLTIIAQYACD